MNRLGTCQTWIATLVTLFLLACSSESKHERRDPSGTPASAPSAAAKPAEAPKAAPPPPGDVAHGKSLVQQYECNRCHDGTGLAALPREKHCTTCHDDIMTGRFKASAAKLTKWRKHVEAYRDAPSLAATGERFEREWIEAYLLEPRDVRPHLVPTMPRLALSPKDARDIAAYLTRDATPKRSAGSAGGDVGKGRRIYETKSCGGCHEFSGATGLETTVRPKEGTADQRRAVALAPDLRFARERFRKDRLVDWLLDPASIKPRTRMPAHSLTRADARHVAAFLLESKLAPPVAKPVPKRLPVLTRQVTYDEVRERVLGVTCHHCHIDPNAVGGDGGPGNTGGFGFKPRRLDLSSYRALSSGFIADDGERHSIFEKMPDGTPRLVASLIARQKEEAGQPSKEIRGMPLGLPALSAEDVQLVETWIAQGRKR